MDSTDTYQTPEQAPLGSWSTIPGSEPRVSAVTIDGERAEVVVDLDPAYRDWVYCRRTSKGWLVERSGNGPTEGWRSL